LPMAFVSGLMGPYMRPIPINASAGMLLSLAVALVVTPWLSLKLLRGHAPADHGDATQGRLHRLFSRTMRPFLDDADDAEAGAATARRATRNRRLLFGGMALAVLAAASLAVVQLVVLKMLPFDNKSELQ